MKRVCQTLLLIAYLLIVGTAPAITFAQDESDENELRTTEAAALLESMDADARVGQLFVVAFEGNDADPSTLIGELIAEYKIGGVILQAENDNFDDREDLSRELIALVNELQQQALYQLPPPAPPTDTDEATATPTPLPANPPQVGLPLFVAVAQDGDLEILSGISDLPSQMAIGATWDIEMASSVGAILGAQLHALGINLLVGPSLDVLASPNPFSPGNLGTATFGGDPYWVGEMGRAYTQGVHLGSSGGVAVFGTHLPGQGGSDRPVDAEIATVRKDLNDLRNGDLIPFFAVTNPLLPAADQVDGMLTTQAHYLGLQSASGTTAPPFSFDPQAINTLLSQPELVEWRSGGGVLLTDSLGTRAIKRFYDETEEAFPHRLVAKDAFLAGNDLLFLSDFGSENVDHETEIENIKDTIIWFREKYATDLSFQQRVDESVLRILTLKLKLYDDNLNAGNVINPISTDLEPLVTEGNNELFALAERAITLLSPEQDELVNSLGNTPASDETIVIFTDVRNVQQCSLCPPQPLISVNALEQRILSLYGPGASGQISPNQISSFTFEELLLYIETAPVAPPLEATPTGTPGPDATSVPSSEPSPTPIPSPTTSPAFFVQEAVQNADWIIFAQLDVSPDDPVSNTVKTFLATRQDLIRDTRIIAFAFGAPFYLDSTEVSKLSAYIGVYSHSAPFIDASVRALFFEAPLTGASPVDIESIDYLINEITQPDSEQIIELFIEPDEADSPLAGGEPVEVRVGDTLRLSTGIIVDYNGNPVPDGTTVTFVQQDRVQGFTNVVNEVATSNGVATLDYLLEARTGNFRITARSGDATASLVIDLIIEDDTVSIIEVSSPTPRPTMTPSPTLTATPSPTTTPSPTATPTPTPAPPAEPEVPVVAIPILKFRLLTGLGMGTVGLFFSAMLFWQNQRINSLRKRTRLLLFGILGGVTGYSMLLSGMPIAAPLIAVGEWAAVGVTLVSGIAGMALYWWNQ